MTPLHREFDTPRATLRVALTRGHLSRTCPLLVVLMLLFSCDLALFQNLERTQLPAINELSNVAGYGWQPGLRTCAGIAPSAMTCDTEGWVTSLTEPPTLGAYLPDSISLLTRLTSLVIRNNLFSDVLPTTLGSLKRLKALVLANNSFSGPLPASTTGLTGLTNLNISRNLFTGAIPAALQILKTLVTVDLSYNYFSGIANLSAACAQLSLASNCFSSTSKCTTRTDQRSTAECAASCQAPVWQATAGSQLPCSGAGMCLPAGAVTASVASDWSCLCNAGFQSSSSFGCTRPPPPSCGGCPKNSTCVKLKCVCNSGLTSFPATGKPTSCKKCVVKNNRKVCT